MSFSSVRRVENGAPRQGGAVRAFCGRSAVAALPLRGLRTLGAVWWLSAVVGCSGAVEGSRAGAKDTTGTRPAIVEWSGARATRDPEVCFNATDDNHNGLLDEGCGVEQGQIQFLAAWQETEVDVDLWVTGPSGDVAAVGQGSADGLTKMRECPGEGRECLTHNQENVVLEAPEFVPGVYRVRLRLEERGGREPPIEVRLGVRISGATRAFVAQLWEPGDEVELEFLESRSVETPEAPKKEELR